MNEKTAKMTYVSALTDLLNGAEMTAEHMEKFSALRDQLAKRNASKSSAEKKPTKTQKENDHIKGVIAALMADGKARTITDIMNDLPMLNDLSSQRVNAIVKQMKDAGALTREVVKRKAYFTIAADGNGEDADASLRESAEGDPDAFMLG